MPYLASCPLSRPLRSFLFGLVLGLLALLGFLVTLAPRPVAAQDAPSAGTTAPTGESFEGHFVVARHGRGRPMIVIPGLTSGGAVWDGLVARYAATHEVHVLTLAGFAGVPAIDTPRFLEAERDAIVRYVRARGLDRPILVGHSLGGFLALWVAATAPELAGPVVAVDGVPWLVALGDTTATPERMQPQAAMVRQMYASLSPEQMAVQGRMALVAMMRDTTRLAEAVAWSRTSDPATAGRAVAEMLTTDLRDRVGAIRSPVLLVAAAGDVPAAQHEAVRARYRAQVAAVRDHRVVVADARHFVMLDAPDFLFATMDAFLTDVAARAPRVEAGR
jgi:N-formylmaleamate deformylase